MKSLKKTCCILSLVICLTLGLFTNVSGAEQLSILVKYLGSGAMGTAFNQILEDFKAKNPDITVNITVGYNLDQLKAMVVSGSVPDLVEFDRYRVGEWAIDKLLLPIDELVIPCWMLMQPLCPDLPTNRMSRDGYMLCPLIPTCAV